jgi:UPF0271 protein
VASAVAGYAAATGTALAVLGLPGSALLAAAAGHGLRTVPEAFADRGYTGHGTLVPRGTPGAVLEDPGTVVAQAVRLVIAGQVEALDGTVVAVRAESICLHGDTPDAVGLARAVRKALQENAIDVAAFAPGAVTGR